MSPWIYLNAWSICRYWHHILNVTQNDFLQYFTWVADMMYSEFLPINKAINTACVNVLIIPIRTRISFVAISFTFKILGFPFLNLLAFMLSCFPFATAPRFKNNKQQTNKQQQKTGVFEVYILFHFHYFQNTFSLLKKNKY